MSIYIITHKQFDQPKLDGYKSLLVGAEKGHVFGDCFDDTGDNISSKNPYYCELTGIYWIWKNTDDKYVGIVHYRRYFSKSITGRIISEKAILKKLDSYDIIVPNRAFLPQTLTQQFKNTFTDLELKLIENAIQECSPDYLDSYKKVMASHEIFFCNMMVCDKELFDDYCNWLFMILFEIEKHVNMSSYNSYQKRLFGFISERLLNVWIEKKNLKVCEIGMVNTETKEHTLKRITKGIRRLTSYYFPNNNLINSVLKRKNLGF